mgnify:CR=1 FL=1
MLLFSKLKKHEQQGLLGSAERFPRTEAKGEVARA